MKRTKKLFLCGVLVLLLCKGAYAQIMEVPTPMLQDIAMAAMDQWGHPVIYYNPVVARMVGPLVFKFFMVHEKAHHYLDHIRREFFEANPFSRAWVRQAYEKEADCFAASHVSPRVARAAMDFFASSQGAFRYDWYHPTGYERAAVIRQCAFGGKS